MAGLLGYQVRAAAIQAGSAPAGAWLAVAIALLTFTYQPPEWVLLAPIPFYGGIAVVAYLTARFAIRGGGTGPLFESADRPLSATHHPEPSYDMAS